ncbi:ribonuclease J [Mycoplasma bradburyae]|uniref:Ribonuclease J n=1 Tax=Mycoplasma bradburyae TaxID=2963128 RepID=A0AAW6HRZ7_9MOLU|nr:ribonuclease J [Mycoplasma bradburyae]MDC4163136.1 ribonuclease J [Mycoplasma bradburyae]MDC4181745.1 ribonuclease J [Mycoplasma bradburyae]MDC4182452.1 ribonuclease J [Mycoplasma bradburyae]MDC4183671.1 ribonuclease J [Mycoplasma bradburyae]MDC4183918.1 ribonuclease J [Mycoplasma bradburyae]
MAKINFFTLGGQDEQGKNCSVLEVNDDIYLFNTGSLVPINSLLGVEQLIPDYSYIAINKKKVKGLFIGYPSQSNLGSLLYLLKSIKPVTLNIYTSLVGKTIIESIMEKQRDFEPFKKSVNIVVLNPLKEFEINENVKVTPFRVFSSIPYSYGFCINTQDGLIVYIDDFILVNDKNKTFSSDLMDLKMMINKKVLLLIVGAGQVGKNISNTSPNHRSKQAIEKFINDSKGRSIIACYDDNVYAIFTAATIARKQQKPFIVYSQASINLFNTIIKKNMFSSRDLQTMPISEMNNEKEAIIVVSGTPHNLYNQLAKIATGEDKRLTLEKEDRFILLTPKIAGFESYEAKILDEIARCDVTYKRLSSEVLPIKASNEDHKFLVNLLRPQFAIPIQGLYKEFVKYLEVVNQTGNFKEYQRPILLYNGEILSFNNGKLSNKHEELHLNSKCIDTAGVQDVKSTILSERFQMGCNGVVTLSMYMSPKKMEFLDPIDIETYGVSEEAQKLTEVIDKCKTQIRTIQTTFISEMKDKMEKTPKKRISVSDYNDFKKTIRKVVGKIFEKNLYKNAAVITSVVELEQ